MAERLDCPKCKAPLETHEVSRGIIVHHCPSCFGVLYGKDQLAVPLELSAPAPARHDCPRCKRAMETGGAYDRAIEVDRCPTCGGLWFDAGEIQILRRLTGVENVAGRPGSEEPKPKAQPAAAPQATAKKAAEGEKIPQPRDMAGVRNPDAENAPTVTYEGRVYQHFQTSLPVTTSVHGEFPWIATVGDTAKVRDFVCPPYLISEEVTEKESTWAQGEYIEPEEVWAWFGMPGNPPPKSGVGPAQPNPWNAGMRGVWGVFSLAAAICFGALVYFTVFAANRSVYEGSFSVAASDLERSRVSEVFEVPGRTSNLEVTVDTNIDGSWAYVSMALIEADTDKAYDFGREVAYYHGVDDGEAWSEGRPYEKLIVPSVPPGRYYLRLEPETDAPRVLSFRVLVRRDVPLMRLPVLALILLLVPVLVGAMRRSAFESERWMESDHGPSESDWEDE